MSKKLFKSTISALLCGVAISFAFVTGCTTTKPLVTAQSIALYGMETEFTCGEEFTADGLDVLVNYSDGTSKIAKEQEYAVDYSAYVKDAVGDYAVTVTLKGTSITQSYSVKVSTCEDAWDYDGVLKVLCIGNSFSVDMAEYAYQIGKSLGINKIYLGNLYIGGCSLDTHADNAKNDKAAYTYYTNSAGKWIEEKNYKLSDALAMQNWDFVTLQQASGYSGITESYSQLEYLINYVKDNLPVISRAKLFWHMTWAYQGNSSHGDFSKYDKSQSKMYDMIISAVQNKILTNDAFAGVIPDGTAVQNARTSFLGDNLTRDGYHMSYDVGRYITGLTMMHALTGLPVNDMEYAPANISAEVKAVAIECAQNAVKTPYAVTSSEYPEFPLPDAADYDLLDLQLEQGYWQSTHGSEYNIIRKDDTARKFFATQRFKREQIPVGSIIILESGWQYRPEGWVIDAQQSSRPDNITAARVVVTESWWSNFTLRAFNITRAGASQEIVGQEAEAMAALKIYVPKNKLPYASKN